MSLSRFGVLIFDATGWQYGIGNGTRIAFFFTHVSKHTPFLESKCVKIYNVDSRTEEYIQALGITYVLLVKIRGEPH